MVVVGYLMPARGYLSRCALSPQVKRDTLRRMLLGAGLSGDVLPRILGQQIVGHAKAAAGVQPLLRQKVAVAAV